MVLPAGASIEHAAAWVGASCRAELVLHADLTRLLRTGSEPGRVNELWTVRAHRAELAEAWYRRLPELREFPREGFVRMPAGDPAPDSAVDPSAAGVGVGDAGAAPSSVEAILDALVLLEQRYLDHLDRAVGPADGPVAETLTRALALTAEDQLALG